MKKQINLLDYLERGYVLLKVNGKWTVFKVPYWVKDDLDLVKMTR